jgi:sRNA-binding carbon storage regulator CsrA
MWVQSRQPGEKLVLPSLHVTLWVLEIRGDRVRLGISAPGGMSVQCLEVWHPTGLAEGDDVAAEDEVE